MTTVKLPSKSSIYRSVLDCGVSRSVLKKVLPQWWDDALLSSTTGFAQFTHILRNQLGITTEFDNKGEAHFTIGSTSVQYKKRASTELKKLQDSTLLAKAAASTVLRVLQYNGINQNGAEIAAQLQSLPNITLENTISTLWSLGVPVLYLDGIPNSFTRAAGFAFRVHDAYAIVLGHKHKSPSTQLFILLHEVGHIVSGHLQHDGVIADETLPELGESLRSDRDTQEVEADGFALNVLRQGCEITHFIRRDGRLQRPGELALKAKMMQRDHGVNAGHYVLSYGRESNDWLLAQQALRFIETADASEVLKSQYAASTESMSFRRDDSEFLSSIQSL